MGFVDQVGEKVSTEIIEPCGEGFEKVKNHPRHFQWGFQTVGDIGLSLSGILTQNYGRAATGIMGTVRDVSFFPLRRLLASGHAETICSVVALGTNIPQLVRSASGPETVAAALVMTGWGLKAAPGLLNGLKLKDVFGNARAALFGTLPALIFTSRGVMQVADGVTRKDPSAIGAGLCFIFGGAAGYYAGRKHLAPAVCEAPAADELPVEDETPAEDNSTNRVPARRFNANMG